MKGNASSSTPERPEPLVNEYKNDVFIDYVDEPYGVKHNEVLEKPSVVIQVGDKTDAMTLEATNFVVYLDPRNSYDLPCVTLPWVALKPAK